MPTQLSVKGVPKVKYHCSAGKLINQPPINRSFILKHIFQLTRTAVTAINPNIAVSQCTIGQDSNIPPVPSHQGSSSLSSA